MLPAKNRIDNTVQYLMVDALGLDFLTNTFMAHYRDGEAEFTCFVARSKSANNAAEVLAKYKAHLAEFGDLAEPAKIEGASVTFADMGGGEFDGQPARSATSSAAAENSSHDVFRQGDDLPAPKD